MLCLPDGKRIKLPSSFLMLFEVQDLEVASPATVSRCGMVYLDNTHLGYVPIIETWWLKFIATEEQEWLEQAQKVVAVEVPGKKKKKGETEQPEKELIYTPPEYLTKLRDMILSTLEIQIPLLRKIGSEPIPSANINLV
jgi:dynein heavy chain